MKAAPSLLSCLLILTFSVTFGLCAATEVITDDDYPEDLDYYDYEEEVPTTTPKPETEVEVKPDDPEDDLDLYEDYTEDISPAAMRKRPVIDLQAETIKKFLIQSTPDDVKTIDYKDLIEYSKHKATIEVLPEVKVPVLKVLLDRIPSDLIADIAGTPGLLNRMSDDRILTFASNEKAVNVTDSEVLISLADSRPHLIPDLPDKTLWSFIVRPDFVKRLSHSTLKFLVTSKAMAAKLKELPRSTLAMIVAFHPTILTLLPADRNYPARDLVSELTTDRSFLRQIPIEIHAWLGQSAFRHQLTPDAVRTILSVYPRLPAVMTDAGLKTNADHFHSQPFLTLLPCSVYLTLANDMEFINRLKASDIRALTRNRKMWSCLPVKTIRRLLGHSKIGHELDVGQILTAASTMGLEKSLDWDVMGNLFKFQLPGLWVRHSNPDFS